MDEVTKKLLSEAKAEIERGDCKVAYRTLLPLIESKVPEALFLYSTFSFPEVETVQEFEMRSVELLKAASEAGFAPAVYSLAVCYELGDLVERNPVYAAVLFKQAADVGYSKAKLSHGLNVYYGSNGVVKNEVLGLGLIRQAAGEGIEEASEILQDLEPAQR